MSLKQTLQNYLRLAYHFALSLRDIRVAGQVVFGVLVVLVTWSGIKAVDTNYELQRQITALEQENTIQQLENDNQKLQNNYYTSDQYLELSARQNFGLGAPGEKELIVPKSVALSYTVPVPGVTSEPKSASEAPAYQRNIQAWVNFFLHRPQAAP